MNQIFQWDRVTLSLGGRWQGGSFQTQTTLYQPAGWPRISSFNAPVASRSLNAKASSGLPVTAISPSNLSTASGSSAALAYDDLTYPRQLPQPADLSPGEADTSSSGPRPALVWQPDAAGHAPRRLSAARWAASALDESYRLEQTQVGGFSPGLPQPHLRVRRRLGLRPGIRDLFGAALDLKFPSRTYAGIQFDQLNTDVHRTIGLFSLNDNALLLRSDLDRRNSSITATTPSPSVSTSFSATCFVLGAGYRYDRAELQDSLPDVPVTALPSARQDLRADLQAISGYVLFNHPSGLFARADATWYHQNNSGYTPAMPGDDFVQENLYVGYRFLHRHAELMFGILNLSGQDYHLNPLNTYMELPRERSFIVRVNFIF